MALTRGIGYPGRIMWTKIPGREIGLRSAFPGNVLVAVTILCSGAHVEYAPASFNADDSHLHSTRESSYLNEVASLYYGSEICTQALDLEQFQLGAALFNGDYVLSSKFQSKRRRSKQQRLLGRLSKRLPDYIVRYLDKKEFAGRMDVVQFKALLLFLDVRYINPDGYVLLDQ